MNVNAQLPWLAYSAMTRTGVTDPTKVKRPSWWTRFKHSFKNGSGYED